MSQRPQGDTRYGEHEGLRRVGGVVIPIRLVA
jgi:hypothetical protein